MCDVAEEDLAERLLWEAAAQTAVPEVTRRARAGAGEHLTRTPAFAEADPASA